MSVAVIVPFLGGCPYREEALRLVCEQHSHPVTIAAGGEPWIKAEAVMPAIERSCADVVVVADADVTCEGLDEAIRAIVCGAANWAVPHEKVHRWNRNGESDEKPYTGIEGGGMVVSQRETLLDIPLDPRFAGWGQEDQSWGLALRTLAGTPWRGTADLIHRWHPPQPRLSRTRGSRESWNLRRRYLQAQHDPERMRSLIEEAKLARSTDKSSVPDRQALAVE